MSKKYVFDKQQEVRITLSIAVIELRPNDWTRNMPSKLVDEARDERKIQWSYLRLPRVSVHNIQRRPAGYNFLFSRRFAHTTLLKNWINWMVKNNL